MLGIHRPLRRLCGSSIGQHETLLGMKSFLQALLRNIRAGSFRLSQLTSLLCEMGKLRPAKTGGNRLGSEPTLPSARVPKSLTFGKDLAQRSQGFGAGLLPAPGVSGGGGRK